MSISDSEPRDFRSRMIHLDAGQRRDAQANRATVVAPFDALGEAPVPYEALFLAHYRAIRELGRGVGAPGLAIVAVHVPSCRLAGRAWLAARARGVRSAIVGRHSEADLFLEAPMLSLRHLVALVPPPPSWDAHAVRYEVLDLRTARALRDERGRRLEGFEAEGPAFVACGPYALFFLQTGDATDWPELATDAWAMLPERIHVREHPAEPDRWRRGAYGRRCPRAPAPGADRTSLVTAVPPPLSAGERLVASGEAPSGALHVESERGARTLPVGPRAIGRGVLLGRYDRCDASDLLGHDHISRAHLLVKRVGDAVVGIDTASTGGTFVGDAAHRARTVALDRGEEAVLGDGLARVRWVSAH
ncbi:MAG TPA: hypothetical protein RMH99_30625 [Sandaracinaceae bacterium LLY-WYZ-13_1]|nr:hypothetical protein [Sandaracinaceae bacterium LLY-WYZ-13_1]